MKLFNVIGTIVGNDGKEIRRINTGVMALSERQAMHFCTCTKDGVRIGWLKDYRVDEVILPEPIVQTPKADEPAGPKNLLDAIITSVSTAAKEQCINRKHCWFQRFIIRISTKEVVVCLERTINSKKKTENGVIWIEDVPGLKREYYFNKGKYESFIPMLGKRKENFKHYMFEQDIASRILIKAEELRLAKVRSYYKKNIKEAI